MCIEIATLCIQYIQIAYYSIDILQYITADKAEEYIVNSFALVGEIEKMFKSNRNVIENITQLGITQSILDGSADEKTMLNYYNRTIEPIISAIVAEMKRKFLTKTARSQKQSILFFRCLLYTSRSWMGSDSGWRHQREQAYPDSQQYKHRYSQTESYPSCNNNP